MNRDLFAAKRKQLSGKLKRKWGVLTHDQTHSNAGRRDQLAGRIQQRRAMSRLREARQLTELRDRNRGWNSSHRMS